ncbi:MAG: hypothetical protein R3B90_21595 [Planctomycetaceae bacterium]
MVRLVALFSLLVTTLSSLVPAEDLRVYTAVNDLSDPAGTRRVVARSLTLFHGGRVYDYMEAFGELVIFEPLNDRFVLIRGEAACIVSFDELKRLLHVADTEAQKYVARLPANSARALRLRDQLAFQLKPAFQRTVSSDGTRLALSGTEFSYDVRGTQQVSPEVLGQYLDYTDWAARLNTVLHDQAMFPAPRESLNKSLREANLLPTAVTLTGRDANGMRMRADHEYRWELQTLDRDMIHQWEQLRESDELQWVTFREYQQRLLTAANGR